MIYVDGFPAISLPQSYIDDLQQTGMLPRRFFPEQPYARGGIVAKSDRYDAEEIWIPPCEVPPPQVNQWWWPTYPWMHSELLVAIDTTAGTYKLNQGLKVELWDGKNVVWSSYMVAVNSTVVGEESFVNTPWDPPGLRQVFLLALVDYRYLYKKLPLSSYLTRPSGRSHDGLTSYEKTLWRNFENSQDYFFTKVVMHFGGMTSNVLSSEGRRRSVVPPDPMVATGVMAPLFSSMSEYADGWTFTDTRFLNNIGRASGYVFDDESLTYGMCLPNGGIQTQGSWDGLASMTWWPTPAVMKSYGGTGVGGGLALMHEPKYVFRGSRAGYPQFQHANIDSATFTHPTSLNGLSWNASAEAYGSTSEYDYYLLNVAKDTSINGSATQVIVKSSTPAAINDSNWSSYDRLGNSAPYMVSEVNDLIDRAFLNRCLYWPSRYPAGNFSLAKLDHYIGNYCSIGTTITVRASTESTNFEFNTPYPIEILPRNCLTNHVPKNLSSSYGYLWSGVRLRHCDILPFTLDSPEVIGALGSSGVSGTVSADNLLGEELEGMPLDVNFSALWNGQTVSDGFGLIRGQDLTAGAFTLEAIWI